MSKLRDRMLRLIQHNAARKVSNLSVRYVQAKPDEREAIQAGIELERWLVESCEQVLDPA